MNNKGSYNITVQFGLVTGDYYFNHIYKFWFRLENLKQTSEKKKID